jgi:rubrerythrin
MMAWRRRPILMVLLEAVERTSTQLREEFANMIKRETWPLYRRIERLEAHAEATQLEDAAAFFRILREAEEGEWRLQEWAEELGISEEDMLIELDRYLHRRQAG